MKISYRKYIDREGTVYRQRIRMSTKEVYDLNNEIIDELILDKDATVLSNEQMNKRMYLDPIEKINGEFPKSIGITLTTKDFIKTRYGIPLKDMNTYIVVKDTKH